MPSLLVECFCVQYFVFTVGATADPPVAHHGGGSSGGGLVSDEACFLACSTGIVCVVFGAFGLFSVSDLHIEQ